MDKNNAQKNSDQLFDPLLETILQSTIITDEVLDEIAESPQLRRQVLNRIASEKSRREKRWFFAWRWQTATAGAFLFLLMAGATIWFFDLPKTEIAHVSNEKTVPVLNDEKVQLFEVRPDVERLNSTAPQQIFSSTASRKSSSGKLAKNASNINSLPAARSRRQIANKEKSKSLPKTEFSTEFIALSYLPASESGQIVRVKVPRSMLVSLGVSTNVERSKELISAEVIVGDDGAARAIRFLND